MHCEYRTETLFYDPIRVWVVRIFDSNGKHVMSQQSLKLGTARARAARWIELQEFFAQKRKDSHA